MVKNTAGSLSEDDLDLLRRAVLASIDWLKSEYEPASAIELIEFTVASQDELLSKGVISKPIIDEDSDLTMLWIVSVFDHEFHDILRVISAVLPGKYMVDNFILDVCYYIYDRMYSKRNNQAYLPTELVRAINNAQSGIYSKVVAKHGDV